MACSSRGGHHVKVTQARYFGQAAVDLCSSFGRGLMLTAWALSWQHEEVLLLNKEEINREVSGALQCGSKVWSLL